MKTNNKVKKDFKKPVKKEDEFESVIIIDKQDDFDNPETGTLYVKGGENLNEPIINYITNNHNKINQIIFTRDWHPKKHMSFKTNGGEWPDHCVQDTPGAQINKELYDALVKLRIPITIVNKGTDVNKEEYGAFEHCATFHHLHPNTPASIKNVYFANAESSSGTRILNNNIVICGIAGDYCVKETIKNLIGHWKKFNVKVLRDGVVSIDGGTALNEFIKQHKNVSFI